MTKESTIQRMSSILADKAPGEIIRLAHEEFGQDLMMTTAFGYSGIVLLSYVKDVYPDIPIYFIDTTFHFEETLKLRLKIMEKWGVNIQKVGSHRPDAELLGLMGEKAYESDPDTCCYYRKVEPLEDILEKNTVWLSAARRDQSLTRAHANVIDIDGRGHIKVNPLFNWTRDDCWTYIRKFDLPYNPLHDQSYPSIGCTKCTNPVDLGGDERSGRWIGLDKTECGLHISAPGEKSK
jgi:phosphoadenosine phosphosulfate reductase